MKITDLTVTLFAWPDIPATTYGRHTARFSGESQLGLVTLRTDAGLEGHAFLGSAMRGAHFDAQGLVHYLKPLVIGQDPLDRERLWQAMWLRNRNTTLRAIGAIDVALWDLGGKIANLPIHRMLGSYRDRIHAYASSAVLGSVAAYAEEAASYKAAGWRAYKIHPPTDPDVDIEVCRAVRRIAITKIPGRMTWNGARRKCSKQLEFCLISKMPRILPASSTPLRGWAQIPPIITNIIPT